MDDRYDRFARYADAGLGAEEFEEIRRFTRPTEKAPVSSAKNTTGAFDTNPRERN